MYTQLQAVAPVMFPKFEEFAKRYCDPKSSVFGPTHNGRCNQYEFTYLLDTNIWYCPRLDELKPEFPDYVRQNVCFSIKKNAQLSKQVESLDIGSGLDLEEKIDLIEELVIRFYFTNEYQIIDNGLSIYLFFAAQEDG